MQVALKSDGSLWKWEMDTLWFDRELFISRPPTRLGTHTDWVALGNTDGVIVSLAADGSLWHWGGPGFSDGLLRPSRKPSQMENIFRR
jgi:hypothetical protein